MSLYKEAQEFGFNLLDRRSNDHKKGVFSRNDLGSLIAGKSFLMNTPIRVGYQSGLNALITLSPKERLKNNVRSMREKENTINSKGLGLIFEAVDGGSMLVQARFWKKKGRGLILPRIYTFLKGFEDHKLETTLLHFNPQYFLFIRESEPRSVYSNIFDPLAYALVPISSIAKDSWKLNKGNNFTTSTPINLKLIKDGGEEMITEIYNAIKRGH